MQKKREKTTFQEISNNVLVLILIVIIFVSVLGTLIVKQAINDIKDAETGKIAAMPTKPVETGRVAFTVLPSKEKGEKEK